MVNGKDEDWMLVTKEHAVSYHGIKNSHEWAKDHMISHIVNVQDHKHFTVDLKVAK
jgi:hypothetical protein